MNDPGRHQPDPEDLDRARRIMESMLDSSASDSGDDALLAYLNIYKKNTTLRAKSSPTEATWESISASIESSEASGSTRILSISPLFWKVAAVLLAVAGLALAYIIMQPSETVLLASSGAERSLVELADGSTVTLRPYSSLYEFEESDTRQTYRIDGEAFFDVAENPARIFTAISGEAKVVVTGTEFTVSNWSDAVRVYLESGSVSFSSLDDTQAVNLEPGEYSEKIGDQITDPVAIFDQTYTGWLTDELTLDSRTVSDVTAEIEHHFNITLEIPGAIRDERLTGTLQLQNREQVFSDLALSLNGRFVRVDENRYRFESMSQD